MADHALTRKEFAVLLAICEDRSVAQVGRKLGITATTVKTHLRSLHRKLGVQTSAEAVTKAWRMGILQSCPTCRRTRNSKDGADCAEIPQHEPLDEAHPVLLRRKPLAPRQQQTLELIALGCTTDEIAAKLFLTSNSVRTNTKNLFRNLGVHDRSHAVAIGFAEGYLTREHVKGSNKPKE